FCIANTIAYPFGLSFIEYHMRPSNSIVSHITFEIPNNQLTFRLNALRRICSCSCEDSSFLCIELDCMNLFTKVFKITRRVSFISVGEFVFPTFYFTGEHSVQASSLSFSSAESTKKNFKNSYFYF